MADDKIALSIEIEADRAQMSLGELEKGFAGLQEKLKDTNRGTEEGRKQFKKLATQMAQTSAEIKNIELSFEGLDKEQIASEFGSVAGGIGDVTASLVLMGGESENIEQMAASIEKAMAISMGFKGAIEGMSSGMKIYNNLAKQGKIQTIALSVAQKAQAIGTKALAIVQGILNAVMSLNPLGLIIIAVVAITAAFVYFGDTMKKILRVAFLPFFLAVEAGIYIWNKFKDTILNILKVAFAPLLLTIKFVTDALKALGIMESDTAKATRLAGDEKIKSYKKQAAELEKLQAAHKKLTDKVIGDMTHEIALLKAKGEYSEGLEWELIGVKIKAAKKAKKIAEDALALEKENKTRAFGWATEEEKKRLKELEDNVAKESDILNSAEEENELFIAGRIGRRRAREKQEAIDAAKLREDGSAQRKKDRAEEEIRLIEEAKALAEFNEEQARIKIQLIQDEGERARAEIEYNSQLELEALEKKGALTFDAEMLIAQTKNKALADLEKTEEDKRFALEKEAQVKRDEYDKLLFDAKIANEQEETEKKKLQLEEDYQNNITRLEKEGLLTMDLEFELLYTKEQALADIEKEFRDKAAAEKQAQRDKDFALASASIGALSALNKAATDTALLNAAGDEEKKEKIRKASFEREKKLNIAMALINGSQAVLAGFAQGGLPMAIVAGVTAAAQLAAIVATTYQGGGSVKEVGNTAPVDPSGAGGAGAGAQINAVTNTSTILGNQQVYVTETDITNTQNNVSVIEESATF